MGSGPRIDRVWLLPEADADLEKIDSWVEGWLVGKLLSLPHVDSGEIDDSPWVEPGKPPRYTWRIGQYAAIFHMHRDGSGRNWANVEKVLGPSDIAERFEEQARLVRARELRIARLEQLQRRRRRRGKR